ncbi:MAG: response regulator transcription factor [Armatimonadota bacterium]
MPNVLIVDDDKDMAEGLKWYLEADGFGVTMAYDGEAALDDFRSQKPDLVILDIMMPKLDGIQVCQAIRSESSAMVIMLSARDSEIDKVRALKLGADDYVTKPFSVSELVARVHAVLRRSPATATDETGPTHTWEGLSLFTEQRSVSVNGMPVELSAMEFDLLSAMMRRRRMVFTRDQIVELIWKDSFFGDMRLVEIWSTSCAISSPKLACQKSRLLQ